MRKRIKEFLLGTRSRPIRIALDLALTRLAPTRVGMNHYDRMHADIAAGLQTELGKLLGLGSEFEHELYVRRFESDFAAACGRRFAVGTHSGTSALQLALLALGIGPGDEVITVPHTYVATALAISFTGARPVFVDVDRSTFNMSPERIEAAITPRTKAILPVHLYGQVANMPAIMAIAAHRGLRVVEDACQAFGAEWNGRKAGNFGDLGCFSFSSPKVFGGLGNGGMVVGDDRAAMERIRRLRNPESGDAALLLGRRTPCYLDAIQVAFLRAKLPEIGHWIARRRAIAARYRQALAHLPLQLPVETEGSLHTYYRFAVRLSARRELMRWLAQRRIRAGAAYAPCLHLSPIYEGLGHSPGSFPNAEAIARDTLWLPISAQITDGEAGEVTQGVRAFFQQENETSDRGGTAP